MACPCCASRLACNCSGVMLTHPSSVTVTLSLGEQVENNFRAANCPSSAAEAIINGTYVLPYVVGSSSSGGGRYQGVFGKKSLGALLYCNQGFWAGMPIAIMFSFAFCDETAFYPPTCFAVVNFELGFGSGGLCSITQGGTTSYSGTTPFAISFRAGCTSCECNDYVSDSYFVDVTASPVW